MKNSGLQSRCFIWRVWIQGVGPKRHLGYLWIHWVWWKRTSALRHPCLWTVWHISIYISTLLSWFSWQPNTLTATFILWSFTIQKNYSQFQYKKEPPTNTTNRRRWNLVLCSSGVRDNLGWTGDSRTIMAKSSYLVIEVTHGQILLLTGAGPADVLQPVPSCTRASINTELLIAQVIGNLQRNRRRNTWDIWQQVTATDRGMKGELFAG